MGNVSGRSAAWTHVAKKSLRSRPLAFSIVAWKSSVDADESMFDSRLATSELNEATGGAPLAAGQTVRLHIAGRQGVPAKAKAASVNITSVDVGTNSYITAFPCGDRPLASNLNITPQQHVTANGAMVKLSPEGDLCVFSQSSVHLVVDINGVWL